MVGVGPPNERYETMTNPTERTSYEPGDICMHSTKIEIINHTGDVAGMRMTIIGHFMGDDHTSNEVISIVSAVPSGAVLAADLLDAINNGVEDDTTRVMTAIALEQTMLDQAERVRGDEPENLPRVRGTRAARYQDTRYSSAAVVWSDEMGGYI